MEKGYEIKVLDHGYVKLADWLGSDESIVEAARTSTGRGFVSWEPYQRCKGCQAIRELSGFDDNYHSCGACGGEVFEKFSRGDLGILDFMYRMGHTSPFEMCELVIDVQVPMDCWRQWIRHRMASTNEYSTRYSEAIDEMQATEPTRWRSQGKTNRQGSGEYLAEETGSILSQREVALHVMAREVYAQRLSLGVAKEQARKDLPLSNYTRARWKLDLHNLLHVFLAKRMHAHAQEEIRTYACAIAEMVKAIWPRAYALFEEYDLYAVRLSRTEAATVARLLDTLNDPSMSVLLDRLRGK